MDVATFYERLQADLVARAGPAADVRAIMVVGSRARQLKPADDYSDLDVSLFVAGSPEHGGEAYLGWLRDFAPVWMIVEEHHDDVKSWLILYRGGIKVDLGVVPVAALQPLIDQQCLWDDQQRGYRVLLDKDGLAARLPAPRPFEPPPYRPPAHAQFVKGVEVYFYGAVYLAKQLRRGNLWKAKWADRIQQSLLLEMLEWHAHAVHEGPVDTYYRGDFMRDWVSDATWQELHGVFARFDAADSRDALLASIGLFTRLAQEAAARLGYKLPAQMMSEVTAYVGALLQGT